MFVFVFFFSLLIEKCETCMQQRVVRNGVLLFLMVLSLCLFQGEFRIIDSTNFKEG